MSTGVFGGSFDPVHKGHVGLARKACEEGSLDRVIFVPARVQPFKQDRRTAPGSARTDMIELAIRDWDKGRVSTFELERDSVSYTADTLEYFRDMLGGDEEIYFMSGADAFLTIDTWYRAERIFKNCGLIVGGRPGYREEEVRKKAEEIRRVYPCSVLRIDNEAVDISSSELRKMIKRGEDVSAYLDPGVIGYIDEHGLYR